ncbi:DEAD/DEAH box helicase family protein [Fervidobacterium thailandense]|uniref:Restriction endonuclease subunit R n=1 Tax=Fervidobacterium thailandense TaxID=1008305 RepID=A0A1E3G419_9BACT|nr:DEAD/DEAH box helicase family protein [Fervidobacterium thailandense]ODN30438.1 restriction endonuclease subunit R [Fervidobacterium thailandense]
MPKTASKRTSSELQVYTLLQLFVEENLPQFEDLPPEWNNIDIVGFSKNKTLWDFQIRAIKNAIRLLYFYYHELEGDKDSFYEALKASTDLQKYEKNLDIYPKDGEIWKVLNKYFYALDERIPFSNISNRMNFWMATGSGKTVVIIKLIDILVTYMERGLIPKRNILFLTYRDDLIEQFKTHFKEFKPQSSKQLFLSDLKEFHKLKQYGSDFTTFPIFYYRSDNISDEQKDKIVDYTFYENNGEWYIILDEAHKGDKESSKRQQYFAIMARNGFLFNFSATFTDFRDIIMTVFEFNLSTFIKEGYGKEIRIFNENVKLHKEKLEEADFTDLEKNKVFLKNLILLAYLKKNLEKVRKLSFKDKNFYYHSPLLIYLVNSVNVDDSDLEILIRILTNFASEDTYKNLLTSEVFQEAKRELISSTPIDPFDSANDSIEGLNREELEKLSGTDILNFVFNAQTPGEIEIIKSTSKKEIALKLMTSDKPFALVRIGDASPLIDKIKQYKDVYIQERFESDDFFSNLENDENINILLGSRAFYEGWDSNRPNIITFVNIGQGTDAKKFILQSIGRGLRIKPFKDDDVNRKRLSDNASLIRYKHLLKPLETLFVWATKKDAVRTVITEVKNFITESGERISLKKNRERIDGKTIYIPVIQKVQLKDRKADLSKLPKMTLNISDYNDVITVCNSTSDEMLYFKFFYNSQCPVRDIELLRTILSESNRGKFISKSLDENRIGWERALEKIAKNIKRNVDYLYQVDVDSNDDEYIVHYKNIVIRLPDKEKVQTVKEKIEEYLVKEHSHAPDRQEVTLAGKSEVLLIEFLKEHYYIPILESLDSTSLSGRISYLIKHDSERKFIEELKQASSELAKQLGEIWWIFSKIVENVDKVYIPYDDNGVERFFYPDFIFWFNKDDRYVIVFVDPKGTEHTVAERKIDGFENLFIENGKCKVFSNGSTRIIFKLYFYNKDAISSKKYRDYWVSSADEIFQQVIDILNSDW